MFGFPQQPMFFTYSYELKNTFSDHPIVARLNFSILNDVSSFDQIEYNTAEEITAKQV